MLRQKRYHKVRVDRVKVRANQAKVNVEERKQKTQSKVKLFKATSGVMGEMRQHKKNVVYELEGQYPKDFHEAGEFHRSHVQVDNSMSVTYGSLNTIKTVTPQNVFSHTNPTIQPGVTNESLPSTKGSGGTMHPPFGICVNRRQQISQLVMRSPPPPDLGKESQISNA